MQDEEDTETLVHRGPSAFLGLRFASDEEQVVVRRITYASGGLCVLALFHFFVHGLLKGHILHGLVHLIGALALPACGWYAAKNKQASLVWAFHLGNVQLATIHVIMVVMVVVFEVRLQSTPTEHLCNDSVLDDPRLPAAPPGAAPGGESAAFRTPKFLPTSPPRGDSHNECVLAVEEEKANSSSLIYWWLLVSFPLFALTLYAAYQSHEYYFQLRLAKLTARVSPESGEYNTVVVRSSWEEAAE